MRVIIADEHMNKKVLIVLVTLLVVVIISVPLVYFGIRSRTQKSSDASRLGGVTPTQTPDKLTTWEDPAGFTFQYPEGIVVNKHDEDTENYAHVELTQKDHPGNVIVWVKDTTAQDILSWARTDARFAGAPSIDTTLGGENAKKFLLTTPKPMAVTGTIFEGLLFSVEADLADKPYWDKVFTTVTGTFTLIPFEENSTSNSSASDNTGADSGTIDEEETIE